jgi:hypothetical protein
MPELHQLDRFGHATGLVKVGRQGLACRDSTELAGPGANIPKYHQRGRAPAPAITHIRALPAGANGMEFMLVDDIPDIKVVLSPGQTDLQPVGLASFLRFHVHPARSLFIERKEKKSGITSHIKCLIIFFLYLCKKFLI